MHARAQTVLPRFIAPPAPLCLWLLLGCLFTVSGLAWLARVPVYRNGVATVVNSNEDDQLIVAFFPPESKSEMRAGQNLSLKLDPAGPPLVRTIVAIEPEILSPAGARKRFNFDDATAVSTQKSTRTGLTCETSRASRSNLEKFIIRLRGVMELPESEWVD